MPGPSNQSHLNLSLAPDLQAGSMFPTTEQQLLRRAQGGAWKRCEVTAVALALGCIGNSLVVAAPSTASAERSWETGEVGRFVRASEKCPEATTLVRSRSECIKAAYALLDEDFCYGVPWEQSIRVEHDGRHPSGCYFSISPPGGCGLHLNMAATPPEAKAPSAAGPGGWMRMCAQPWAPRLRGNSEDHQGHHMDDRPDQRRSAVTV